MEKQKGIIALTLPVLLLGVAAVVFALIYLGAIKLPGQIQIITGTKEPTVTLQKQYTNPFDKSAQYVNPFSSFKNPFDVLKEQK